MGNKLLKAKMPPKLSKEELFQRQKQKAVREKLISRTRAAVVRSQIVRAYEILENIRFDHVSDTAFRDKITRAKRGLESAINDFLLYDGYWEKRIDKFRKMTPEEYNNWLKRSTVQESK